MSNSSLICYTRLSPHCTKMTNKVNKKITIHHMAGNLSVETCGSVFQSRRASSNYGIGSDGRIALYVNECDRSWASSSYDNDSQAVTIEVANSKSGGNWPVSDKAYASLINLCVDICKRNGIEKLNFTGDKKGNLTQHNYFAATACPGPYLKSKFKQIAEEVNARLADPTLAPVEPEKEFELVDGVYKVKKGKDVKLSTNFVSSEFDCNGSNCCSETLIDEDLVKYLQKIRDHFGKPVVLTCGYRCPTHNAKVANASSQSKHMYGMAADFYISGVACEEIAKYAESIGVLGIGLYPPSDGNFVHIDTRTSKSFWYGHAGKYRSTFGGGNETDLDEVLNRGDKGDRVKKLQQNLKDLGYTIAVDGSFGSQTESIVIKFQKEFKISATGVVDEKTEEAIEKALQAKAEDTEYGLDDFIVEVQKVLGVEVTGEASTALLNKTITVSAKINRKHPIVVPIQKRLAAMGYTEVGTADGVAGSKFTKAVKRLQKEKGKNQDGEITKGKISWKLLLGMIK